MLTTKQILSLFDYLKQEGISWEFEEDIRKNPISFDCIASKTLSERVRNYIYDPELIHDMPLLINETPWTRAICKWRLSCD